MVGQTKLTCGQVETDWGLETSSFNVFPIWSKVLDRNDIAISSLQPPVCHSLFMSRVA